MLALSCAPEGRPDAAAAAAAVMLAELLARRGLARLGLHVRDGDQLHELVAVAAQHTLSFSFSHDMWCRCSWRKGGVLAAPTLAAQGRVGEVRWRCANAGE